MKNSIISLFVLLSAMLVSFHCDDTPIEQSGSITVLAPNGGEQWQIGTTRLIQWSSSDVSGDIKIEVSYDGGATYSTVAAGTMNDGSEAWNILEAASTQTKIRISSLSEPGVVDESDATFTVSEVVSHPTNLQANVTASHDITLAWQDNSSNESGFIIERMIGRSGAWVERARVATNVLIWKDSLLASDWEYSYRVRAYNANGISGETNTVMRIIGWVQQQSPTTRNLYGVAYPSTTVGVVVGEQGTLLRTTNSGHTWQSVNSGTSNPLYGVSFGNAVTGVAVGDQGTVLFTNNGGTSWSASTIGGTGYTFKSVRYATVNDVFIVGYRKDQLSDSTWGVVYRSTDGGVNWGTMVEQWRYKFEDVAFSGSEKGIVIGSTNAGNYGAIFRTTNGGLFWSKQSNDMLNPFLGATMLSVNVGLIVGTMGTVLHTANGGTNWADQSIVTNRTLRRIIFSDNARGVIIGDNGTIYRTTDGGTSWSSQSSGTPLNLHGISLLNAGTQTIVGANGLILKTDNGGL